MGILEKLFSFKKNRPKPITELARVVGDITDNLAQDIFSRFGDILGTEQITYVVPAIWGTSEKGEIDQVQRQIYALVVPAMKKILGILSLKGLSPSQDFAVEFIIRGLIVSKITYMVTVAFHPSSKRKNAGDDPRNSLLAQMEPQGHA